MNASTWKRILTDLTYSAPVTIGMHRIERLDADAWAIDGERLDFEFALYALVK